MYVSIYRALCVYVYMTVEGYQLIYSCLCSSSVYTLIYWNGKTQISCSFQRPLPQPRELHFHQRVVRHPAQNPFTRVARPKRRSALPPAVTLGGRQQQRLPLPPPAPRNRHLLAAGPQVPGRCHRTGHGHDSCDFSQDVSLSFMGLFAPGKYSRLKAT